MVDICSLPSSTVVKDAGALVGSSVGVPVGSAAGWVSMGLVSGGWVGSPALEQAVKARAMVRASRRAVSFFIVFISFISIE